MRSVVGRSGHVGLTEANQSDGHANDDHNDGDGGPAGTFSVRLTAVSFPAKSSIWPDGGGPACVPGRGLRAAPGAEASALGALRQGGCLEPVVEDGVFGVPADKHCKSAQGKGKGRRQSAPRQWQAQQGTTVCQEHARSQPPRDPRQWSRMNTVQDDVHKESSTS